MRPTRAIIDLEALEDNINHIRERAGDKKICAVVKADAYGHGLKAIEFLEDKVDYFGVAFIDEGMVLREAGITLPIMLLGYTPADEVQNLIDYDIEPALYDLEFARALSEAAVRADRKVSVHLKINTGMNRIGILYSDAVDMIKEINSLPGIEIKGIFSHFATADEKDKDFTQTQIKRFNQLITSLKKEGIEIPLRHIENSAALIDFSDLDYDMVRPGIILYGYYPSEEVRKENLPVRPVMKFMSKVVQVKEIEAGEGIGYGRTFIAEKPMKIATFPAGYADGYSRILSHKGTDVFIKGRRAPVLGNICMDQAMIDVSDIPDVRVGEDIELFGDNISGDEIAEKLGTISYEVTCMVNKRVPRVYTYHGKEEIDNQIL